MATLTDGVTNTPTFTASLTYRDPKAALDWRPALPTYREGLAAILAAGG